MDSNLSRLELCLMKKYHIKMSVYILHRVSARLGWRRGGLLTSQWTHFYSHTTPSSPTYDQSPEASRLEYTGLTVLRGHQTSAAALAKCFHSDTHFPRATRYRADRLLSDLSEGFYFLPNHCWLKNNLRFFLKDTISYILYASIVCGAFDVVLPYSDLYKVWKCVKTPHMGHSQNLIINTVTSCSLPVS